ncbi:hypothetical protein Trisim1_012493 [Trichoderma cf. simile WF8]
MSPWRLGWAVVLLGSQLGISKHQSLSHRDLGWAMPVVGRATNNAKGGCSFPFALKVLSCEDHVKIMSLSANHLHIAVPIRLSNERLFHFPRRIDADISSPLQIRPCVESARPPCAYKPVRLRYDRAISKLPSAQANAFPRYHQQPNSVTPNAILPILAPDIKEEEERRSKIRENRQRPKHLESHPSPPTQDTKSAAVGNPCSAALPPADDPDARVASEP